MPLFMITETDPINDSVIPLDAVSVTSVHEATEVLGNYLIECGMELGDYLTILDAWHNRKEADVCGCGNPECGNVVLPVGVSPDTLKVWSFVYLAQG